MRLRRENDLLLFTLNLLESRLLLRVFRQLGTHYRLKPGELDLKAASAWYSTRGCATAKMSKQETEEWVEHLHAFKGARLPRLEDWARQLSEIKRAQAHLRLPMDDASAFLTTLNDYRLLTAARRDIGQKEMDIRSPPQLLKLPPDRQEALMEIHLLAWLIEETLRLLQE